jgi:putative transposase
MFVNMLRRKLEEQGRRFVVTDRFYPSSRTCSACGTVKTATGLSERVYVCEECGHAQDRDMNAAVNIRAEGLRILGLLID